MRPCDISAKAVWIGHKKRVPSTILRRFYREHVGALDDGEHVHHTCGVPACIEPTHLEAVSPEGHVKRHARSRFALSFDGEYGAARV